MHASHMNCAESGHEFAAPELPFCADVACRGMHAQLEALRQLLALLDPPLHAHLARQDALNLFFCYRWVLIQFKREFKFDQVLRLWEALWARPKDHVHL